jgi:hypothetical protein
MLKKIYIYGDYMVSLTFPGRNGTSGGLVDGELLANVR